MIIEISQEYLVSSKFYIGYEKLNSFKGCRKKVTEKGWMEKVYYNELYCI